MREYIYNSDAQKRLLGEIYGEKAMVAAAEKNRENRGNEIQKALQKLPREQKDVIAYRYGFADGNFHTVEEAARHLGISTEEAKQATALALRTLRSPPCATGLRVLLSQL